MSLSNRLGKLEKIYERPQTSKDVRAAFMKRLIDAEARIYIRAAADVMGIVGEARWAELCERDKEREGLDYFIGPDIDWRACHEDDPEEVARAALADNEMYMRWICNCSNNPESIVEGQATHLERALQLFDPGIQKDEALIAALRRMLWIFHPPARYGPRPNTYWLWSQNWGYDSWIEPKQKTITVDKEIAYLTTGEPQCLAQGIMERPGNRALLGAGHTFP